MAFSGINKICGRCVKDCKQFEQVTVVYCPLREQKGETSNSKNDPKNTNKIKGFKNTFCVERDLSGVF
jgi:hypothetical protein